ncbi:MAG: lactonase family protein [Proteobacteria bacterium]|nr:lactonase family protein [Pseudomonadota bacterium]
MGIINGQAVTNIAVTCSPPNAIGGTVSGLSTGSVTLLVNSADPKTVSATNTSFQFPTELATGQAYTVTVQTQPAGQTCTVSNGTGLASSSSFNAVQVNCATRAEYAYVANHGGGTGGQSISAYSVDASASGTLTAVSISPFAAGTYPTSVAVDPTGQFLYVANDDPSNTVSAYSISAATGALTTPPTSISTGVGANSWAVTVAPQGFVYVANSGIKVPGTVSAFTFDPSKGFSPITGSPSAAGLNPESVAVNPAGTFAFVANFGSDTISVYAIAPNTGALSPVGSPIATGVNPYDIAINPEGTFLYVANYGSANVSAYSISSKGTLAPIAGSPFGSGAYPFSLAINPAGTFAYVANDDAPGSISAYSIDPISGALTSISSPIATGNNPHSITIDPSGRFAYVANFGDNTASAYAIASSGALTHLGDVNTGAQPYAMTIAQP